MRPTADHDRRGTRIPLFLGLGFALLVTWAWRPLPTGIWHDDGVYLLISKALAAGDGFTYAGVVGSPPAAKFPPLYSLVLTPFWLLGDDLAAGSGWVAALNVVFMSAAAAIFVRFLIVHGGLSSGVAVIITVVAWCSPSVWRLTAIPLSEPLFMLAATAALPASAALFRRSPSPKVWPFVLAFAAAYLTRTAGIALAAAAVLTLVLRKDLRRATAVGLMGAAVVLPWTLWSSAATRRIEAPFRDLLGSYGSWLGEQVVAAPDVYISAVGSNLVELASGLTHAAVPVPLGPVTTLFGLLFGACVLLGIAPALRINPLLVWYPLAYLGILMLWPYRSGRLIAPVIPWVVFLASMGAVQGVAGKRFQPVRRAWLGAVGTGALLLVGHSLWTMATGGHLAAYEIRARTLARAVSVIEETSTPEAIIGAPELWAAIHLHTGRQVAPSARFLPLAPDGVTEGTPEQQYEMWKAAGLDHLLVEHGGKVHGPALDRLDETCKPGTVELLASFTGPGYFVRLDLEGC